MSWKCCCPGKSCLKTFLFCLTGPTSLILLLCLVLVTAHFENAASLRYVETCSIPYSFWVFTSKDRPKFKDSRRFESVFKVCQPLPINCSNSLGGRSRVGPKVGMDGSRKSRPYWDSIPGLSTL